MQEFWDLIRGQREVRKAQLQSLSQRRPVEIAIQNELDLQNHAYALMYDLFNATLHNAPEILAASKKRISERRKPLTLEDLGILGVLDDSVDRRLLIDWGNKVQLTSEEEEIGQRILDGNAQPNERLLVKDCSSIIASFEDKSLYFSTSRSGYRTEVTRPSRPGMARHAYRIPTKAYYRTADGSSAIAEIDYERLLEDPSIAASIIEQKLEDPIRSLMHLPS